MSTCVHSLATVLTDFHSSLVHIRSFCSTSLTQATTPVLLMKLNARYFSEKNIWAFSFLFRIGPCYPNCAPGVLSNWLKRPRRETSHPSPSVSWWCWMELYFHSLLCPHGIVVKRQLWRVHPYVFQTVAAGNTWSRISSLQSGMFNEAKTCIKEIISYLMCIFSWSAAWRWS